MQSIYTGGVEVKEEDYRSDRLLLEELVAEMRRLHRRLDEYEPHARRLIDNPITRMLRSRTTHIGGNTIIG